MSRIVETDRDGHDLQERSFPYNQRCADLPALRVQYAQAEPYPNIVLDQFLQPWAAEGALAEFSSIESPYWTQYKRWAEVGAVRLPPLVFVHMLVLDSVSGFDARKFEQG